MAVYPYMCMNEVKIRGITRSDFRTILKWLGNTGYTFKQVGSDGSTLGIDLIRPNEDLMDISLEDYFQKNPPGDVFIDYPMKYPIYANMIGVETVFDLVMEVRKILSMAFDNYKEVGISEYIKLGNLYIDRFVVCRNNDIIVYIKNNGNYE